MHLSTVLSSGLGVSISQVLLGGEKNVLRETSFPIPPKKTEHTLPNHRSPTLPLETATATVVLGGDWHLNHGGKKECF